MSQQFSDLTAAEKLLAALDPEKKIYKYFDLLFDENKKINLVSRETSLGGLVKLAAESLAPFENDLKDSLSLPNGSYLDIGSGGGFPALPVAIVGQFSKFTLVERTQKKAAALTRISKALDLQPKVISGTFEEVSISRAFDLITMRLVRLDERLFKKVMACLKPGGCFLYYSDYPNSSKVKDISIVSRSYSIGSQADSFTCTIITKN